MIKEYTAIAKKVSGETVYMTPFPELIKKHDITRWEVGIKGIANHLFHDKEEALIAFKLLNKKKVDELKALKTTARDADSWLGSKFFSLSLLAGLKKDKRNRKKWS